MENQAPSFDSLSAEKQAEIKKLIAASEPVAAKSVITLAIDTIEWLGNTSQVSAEVVKELSAELRKRLGHGKSGCIIIEVGDVCKEVKKQIFLMIGLKFVPATYRTEISVPNNPEFVRGLFNFYGQIKETARTFWQYLIMESGKLGEDLRDLGMGDLKVVEENPTTMTFFGNSPHRVGITAGYFDRFGKPIHELNAGPRQ